MAAFTSVCIAIGTTPGNDGEHFCWCTGKGTAAGTIKHMRFCACRHWAAVTASVNTEQRSATQAVP